MKTRVKWIEQASFIGESGSGHAVVMDGPPDFGGRNLGVRPMEMILMGLGGCTVFDVMHILHKSRQVVEDCWVEIDAERADTEPKVFTKIHIHFVVCGGEQLSEKQVHRAVALSTEKYCSASIMLSRAVPITHDVEIRIV